MVLITEMLEICIQTSYDQNVQLILKSYLPVVYGTLLNGAIVSEKYISKTFPSPKKQGTIQWKIVLSSMSSIALEQQKTERVWGSIFQLHCISWQEQVTFRWDDNGVCLVLDQHT